MVTLFGNVSVVELGIQYYITIFSRYVGLYGNFAYGNVSVEEVGDGDLQLVYGTRGRWDLQHVDGDNFIGFGHINLV